jgi:hypothetical protein
MTTAIKVKVVRRPVLKLKVLPRIPANLVGDVGIVVVKNGVTYTIKPDYSNIVELTSYDPTQKLFVVIDRATGVWNQVSLSSILTGSQTVQIVTAAGDVTVQPNDGLIILNKTVSAATTSSFQPQPIRLGWLRSSISRRFRNNNITCQCSVGSEKIQGLSGWKLNGQGASIALDPISRARICDFLKSLSQPSLP